MSFDANFQCASAASQTETQALHVLISGASFAGLTTAFWMNRLGYKVTVVEIGKGLKMGGSPVDIKEGTVDIVGRMGLLERIQAISLKAKAIDFLDVDRRADREVAALRLTTRRNQSRNMKSNETPCSR